jgi:diguanylate cyclase (GGDEF)-like protein
MLGPHARVSEVKLLNSPASIERHWACGCAAGHSAGEANVARWRACSQHEEIFFRRHWTDVYSGISRSGEHRRARRSSASSAVALLLCLFTFGGIGLSGLLKRLWVAESEALIDSLTGLYNRRGWNRRALEEDKRLLRQPAKMTVFMMDVDDLKLVNDRDGHPAGDMTLKSVASVIQVAKRDTDIAARLGGDEFALLAVDAGTESADIIAARLGRGFAAVGLSVSIGRSEVTSHDGIAGAVERADQAMYANKERRKRERHSAAELNTGER